jgi:hypothetical protein
MPERDDFAAYDIRLKLLFHFYSWPILKGRWRYKRRRMVDPKDSRFPTEG